MTTTVKQFASQFSISTAVANGVLTFLTKMGKATQSKIEKEGKARGRRAYAYELDDSITLDMTQTIEAEAETDNAETIEAETIEAKTIEADAATVEA